MLLGALLACGMEGSSAWWNAYEPRPASIAPAGEGDAPLAGSLGPPEHPVEPVFWGPATRTREGSSGPPLLPPGETPGAPLPYEIEGPNQDGHRITAEPGGS